jgi:hypothetical protein
MLTAKEWRHGAEFSNSIAIKTDRLPHSAGPFSFCSHACDARHLHPLGRIVCCNGANAAGEMMGIGTQVRWIEKDAPRPAPIQGDCAPPSLQLLLRRLHNAVKESQRLARQRQRCATELSVLARRQSELAVSNRQRHALASERCQSGRARLREGPAPVLATIAPSLQSSLEFDVFYAHAGVECHLAIRDGPGAHLSAMFVSRDTGVADGASRVTRVALRPELSERPENLANQILRALFAQGDPLQHAPQRSERRKIIADLLHWAAHYQACRAHMPLHRAAPALPAPPMAS